VAKKPEIDRHEKKKKYKAIDRKKHELRSRKKKTFKIKDSK